MSTGAPFALLATAQLLAVAAWGALAGGALFPRLRSRRSALLTGGGVLLGVAEAVTGSRLGESRGDGLAWLRAAGALLLVLGLLRGAPRPRTLDGTLDGTLDRMVAPPVLAVAPLAASLPPAAIGCAALLAAGVLAARRPAPGRLPLAAGLLLAGLAAGLAGVLGAGDQANGGLAIALLVLRALAALAIIAWATLLAAENLLAKILAAIVSSVVLAAVVLASVLGTVVSNRLAAEQAAQVADVDASVAGALLNQSGQVGTLGVALAGSSDLAGSVLGLKQFNSGNAQLAAVLPASGPVRVLDINPDGSQPLSADALAALRESPFVQQVLAGTAPQNVDLLVVPDAGRLVPILLSAAGTSGARQGGRPTSATLYGIVVTPTVLRANRRPESEFGATVVSGDGRVAASSLPAAAAQAVADDPRVRAATSFPAPAAAPSVSVSGGSEPTLAIAAAPASLGDAPALLVVSADARASLAAQRAVLEVLFVTLLGAALLVTLLAALLGRQIVDPLRRLTGAADRVRGGDLTTGSGVGGRDEVGRLAASFDLMTASLLQAASDLRATAAQEAGVRERLETVLAAVSDGLVVADSRGRVESLNPAAAALTGEAVGGPLADALQGLAVVAGTAVEGVLRAPDGRAVPVVAVAAALADGAGTVVVLRDTSREREVERMKTEFLSNVSHELRTPLTPIRGYADILVRKAGSLPPEKTAQYAGVMVASAVRLTRVVDLLVDVAALDAGRVLPEPAAVGVGAFVDARLAAWRARQPARAADLRRRVSAGLPRAYVDPAWLAKAVDELLDNALKYSAPGSPVTLVAEPGPGGLQLSVRDAGEGIAAERLAGLFSDFEQVDGSATRARDGLGLGLAFVRRVADVVGLRLTVTSALGRGSSFTLQVPSLPAAPAEPAAPAVPAVPTQKRRRIPSRRNATAGPGQPEA